MTPEELLSLRWAAHGLGAPGLGSADRAVAHLGALQSQDEAASLLAATLRCAPAGTADVEAALAAGTLLRAHVLRPTWHLVHAADLRWMTALTGPAIGRALASAFRQAGVGPAEVDAAVRLAVERLGGGPAAKEDFVADWAAAGLTTASPTDTQYLVEAEARGLICQVGRRGRQVVYDLADRVLPAAAPLDRDEALARLASVYLRGHGPAADRDFAWWGGLGLTEARRGLAAAGAGQEPGPGEAGPLWLPPEAEGTPPPVWAWLPAFDEYLLGYADRTAVLRRELQSRVITSNGIFRPVVLRHGVVAGTWKTAGAPTVEVEWLDEAPAGADDAVREWSLRLAGLRGRS